MSYSELGPAHYYKNNTSSDEPNIRVVTEQNIPQTMFSAISFSFYAYESLKEVFVLCLFLLVCYWYWYWAQYNSWNIFLWLRSAGINFNLLVADENLPSRLLKLQKDIARSVSQSVSILFHAISIFKGNSPSWSRLGHQLVNWIIDYLIKKYIINWLNNQLIKNQKITENNYLSRNRAILWK